MTELTDIPAWVAWVTSIFCLLGSLLALVGNLGLIRLKNFYDRVHAPTLGATLGTGFILIASMLFFSFSKSSLVMFSLLIAVFMTVTTPVGLILLVRAAMYRDLRKKE